VTEPVITNEWLDTAVGRLLELGRERRESGGPVDLLADMPPAARLAARLGTGLFQKDIAAVIGVTANMVTLWERGERPLVSANACRYAAIIRRLAAAEQPEKPS
jgi:DNA-binding transcriptional regulator YiaG